MIHVPNRKSRVIGTPVRGKRGTKTSNTRLRVDSLIRKTKRMIVDIQTDHNIARKNNYLSRISDFAHVTRPFSTSSPSKLSQRDEVLGGYDIFHKTNSNIMHHRHALISSPVQNHRPMTTVPKNVEFQSKKYSRGSIYSQGGTFLRSAQSMEV